MRKRKTPRSEASAKGRKQINEDSWRAELNAVSINEDSWWCMVMLLVETIEGHAKCVSIFNAAAEDGKRKAIYALSYQKTVEAVKVLSNQPLDKCPTIQGVCHYASKILNEDNGVLPGWLMARVIKYLICRAKEENIGVVKKLADLEREIDEEYEIMQTVADWGQPKSKGFDPEVFNMKANTKLRKRNEEWRDAVYVDDAPINGPNLYVVLTGFHDPDILEQLMEAGVPLFCVIRIKRPEEQLDRNVGTGLIDPLATRKLQFSIPYEVDKIDLLKFWTTVEKRWMDPQNHPDFCDIALVTFCPPNLPRSCADECETVKTIVYDSVSHFVYDVYDLHRQHTNYLKSMKVDTNISKVVEDKVDMKIYEEFLDDVPEECVTVPLILFAMLKQVDTQEENDVDEKGDAEEQTPSSDDKSVLQSPADFVRQKLTALNLEFDLDEEQRRDSEHPNEIELIQGDSLNEVIRFFRSTTSTNLMDDILPIFLHPSIGIFDSHPEISEQKRAEYSRHIDETRAYFFDRISHEEVKHYLHILVLDRMIFGPYRAEGSSSEKGIDLQDSMTSLRRSKSLELTSKSGEKVRFYSDGNIDYGKVVPAFVKYAPLFDLIDPRELLSPGYLKERVFSKRRGWSLEIYDEVEALSTPIFLQILYECLQTYDHIESRYFEPTDSLLLYFGCKRIVNGVHQEQRMNSIRTPVRLHDFTEYVVPEEAEWIRREEAMYIWETTQSIERLMRKSAEMYDETLLFRDEDFILPGSLKARDLEKRQDFRQQKRTLEIGDQTSTSVEESVESSKKKKKKRANEKPSSMSSADVRFSLTKRQSAPVDTVEKENVYEFVGYDLGRLRVQITNTKKTFYSADGTLVQVEMDDWLYKDKDLRITVTVHDYSLRLFQRINNSARESSKMFHLTTEAGIILAFEKFFLPPYEDRSSHKQFCQNMNVHFKASWPTGLLIEPITGTESDDPFYICQSYVTSRGYGNINGVHEVCRKFLRNGTILKYLDDGQIIVLRPNGVVVTCTAFEKLRFEDSDSHNDETNFQRDGTRITTGYIIEKEPVTCDWTEEEILRYFIFDDTEETDNSVSFSNLKYVEEAASRHSLEDVTGLLIEDAFVSVLLTCRVEHKNYATVFYDQSTVSCTLLMPDEVRVSISRRGDYEVSMADGVNLKIKEDGLSFGGNSCAICGSQSTSTYEFFPFESPAVIFSSRDVFKNVFEVKDDGTTSYHRKEPSGSNSNVDLLEGKEIYEEEDERFEHRCDHERLCFQLNDIRCRIFSINRNLTAYEYLHRSASNRAELATAFDNETSAILYPSSRRPKLRRLIMFEPSKPEPRSKTLLTFQYPELKPTNFDRRKLLRSTYSIPYDWPFPFGKNGNGIWENTHDLPLTCSMEQNLPKLLKIRVLYGFKEQDVNAVIDLQRALGRYWMSIASGTSDPKARRLDTEKVVHEESKTIYDHLEDNLLNLAFGVTKYIDVLTYESGFEKHWRKPTIKAPVRSSTFNKFLIETASNKEEIEWYKRCMREGIVLPYFQNVNGFCFLWIEECMTSAVKISRANRLAAKMQKNRGA
ncbi:uncharacterized protein LOC105662405 isoform X2 [Megachile rotundata]|uniref:uncharacterized protein LOC105662405 isoform X2 n=1 Tax=Megachile rotundata TaxID=143995 RepID=UPI003FCF27C4